MKKKERRLLFGIALVGVGLYLYNRSRNQAAPVRQPAAAAQAQVAVRQAARAVQRPPAAAAVNSPYFDESL